jgi:hypothetical protein
MVEVHTQYTYIVEINKIGLYEQLRNRLTSEDLPSESEKLDPKFKT